MRKILLPFLSAIPMFINAQVNLKTIKKESYQVFVYHITAATAEKYIDEDSIDVDAYVNQAPTAKFASMPDVEDSLPTGHYLVIRAEDNRVNTALIEVSDLLVYAVNNRHNVQLLVRNNAGNFFDNAQVWVNKKRALYNSQSQAYVVKQKYPDEALVKIYVPGDSTFVSLSVDEDYNEKTLLQQRWQNFKGTRTGRVVTWLPRKIAGLFGNHRYSYHYQRSIATGMVIFNQPKYKLTDTVKCKAYIYKFNGHRYNRRVYVYLTYNKDREGRRQLLTTLLPATPGSYFYQFPLSDTLENDRNYTVEFSTKKSRRLISRNFKTEDYLLDEVSKYSLRAGKNDYYPGDTMHFYASASDANGLSMLDGSGELTLSANNIGNFYEDTLYVPDTLYHQTKPLAAQGETAFDFPVANLPPATFNITATLTFRNSNNELHEETIDVHYGLFDTSFEAYILGDTVFAAYKINGKNVAAKGSLCIDGEVTKLSGITFPAALKVDPLIEKYTFCLGAGGRKKDTAIVTTNDSYILAFDRVGTADSVGFSLGNPMKIPVTFSVFDGNALIASGKQDGELIRWVMQCRDKKHVYNVKWQYMWHDEEKTGSRQIELLYKIVDIKIGGSPSVFPGQQDTIKVDVKDYKNKPVAGMDLTAVSYNNQFQNNINVPNPPYLLRYKLRPEILHSKFETDYSNVQQVHAYPLGKHKGWLKILGLDTMPYYRMLFPATGYIDMPEHVETYMPQVSVHVTKNGERQQVYLLYLNNNPVYYYDATDSMPYAFTTYPGYTKITIRLYDRLVEADSIYIQPNYKHDIVFDLDSLPPKAKLTTQPHRFTYFEKSMLNNHLWLLDNNYITNNSYVWQYQTVVHIKSNNRHIAGPFQQFDSLHFFAPHQFDSHFIFEPGYEYNLSKKILRLEKKPLFTPEDSAWLKKVTSPIWVLGDTIADPPTITYPVPVPYIERFIRRTSYNDFASYNPGKIYFTVPNDTSLQYVILRSVNSDTAKVVQWGTQRYLFDLDPGTYSLLLVNNQFNTAVINGLVVQPGATLCVHTEKAVYDSVNAVVDSLISESMWPVRSNTSAKPITPAHLYVPVIIQEGPGRITGRVIDKKGNLPIPFATIVIKGTRTGTVTGVDGSFEIKKLKNDMYTLEVTAVGYERTEISAVAGLLGESLSIPMTPSSAELSEVVVTGYGAVRQSRALGYSVSTVGENIFPGLVGKVSGVQVSAGDGTPGDALRIVLRGERSATTDGQLFVVDGIPYNKLPANITPDMVTSISVLGGNDAIAVYGVRAAAGVVVITTKTKSLRKEFRDYAFWEPQLFTDENGHAQFAITYPDNITGWQTFVVGMDKHNRIGKASVFVQSYKPVSAQLSTPQFLLEGDTTQLVGKAFNYTTDAFSIKSSFGTGHMPVSQNTATLLPKASLVQLDTIVAPAADTLTAGFNLQTTTGFKDGEERQIPIFKRGTEEMTGGFWRLSGDTSFAYTAGTGDAVEIYAENNALGMLLKEVEYLKKYPYYCMEQVSSKLKGLLMEKKIDEALHKPFEDDKMTLQLLDRLLKNQQFEGGWSWWPGGKTDLFITNYVIQALLPLRDNPVVETGIRNGLLYLQNQLSKLDRDNLLATLLTMAKARHQIDYEPWLEKIAFDSLSTQQQWQFTGICQALGKPHTAQLNSLLQKAVPGMLGSLHWGEENYSWYSDANATTVLAFEVLQNEKPYGQKLDSIVQYFLEQRKQGYFSNTVASASILSVIVPYVIRQNINFQASANVTLTGDTTIAITHFPYKATLHNNNGNIAIHKSGGGLTYLTLYQRRFNAAPKPVTGNFNVSSYFEKNGQRVSYLTAGTKVNLLVEVKVLQDADYVMLEIPIPAGCSYASKETDAWDLHKEFAKNKVAMFTRHLSKGTHIFTVELEARYNGSYTLNPAKVSLMYFPTYFGRNELKKVEIK